MFDTAQIKPLIIYHGNCTDGFAAAWCFWRKYKYEAEYIAGVYQTPPPDVTDRDVYLVDFSYKRSVIEDMISKASSVTLIDHHKTSIEDLSGLDKLIQFTDLEHSGAVLAWDFLFPTEQHPILLDHIEDRDLWRFKLEHTREIQAAIFSYKYNFELWDIMMNADHFEISKMVDDGTAIERKLHKDVEELVNMCKRLMFIGGYEVFVASLPYTLTSEAGHLMAKDKPFAACYWDVEDGRVFSLRSTDDGVDVSEIAKQYGGGGHLRASGFKVPRNHVLAMS